MTTVLLTGMPRSGTSLVCAMLNEQPNTVALVEAMSITPHGDRQRIVEEIDRFVAQTRQDLLETGVAPSKHIGGAVPENTVAQLHAVGLRPVAEQHGELLFDKTLTRNFCLAIKHPAMFTALASVLAPRYPFYAIVRNPLMVLASWQTVDMPVNRGRMPMAEAFDPCLTARLAHTETVLARQIVLMEWLLTTYRSLPAGHVLRYEDILADPTRRLAPVHRQECSAIRPRQPFEPRSRYARVDFIGLAAALRPLTSLAHHFYPEFSTWLDQAE